MIAGRAAAVLLLAAVGAVGAPAFAAEEPLVVEAEDLDLPNGWQRVTAGYLQNVPSSGGYMARCGAGEAAAKVAVPTAGLWVVWVRSHGAENRGVRVRVGETLLPGEVGKEKASWTKLGPVDLPAGPVKLLLCEARGGPYVDVLLLTRDPGYDPATSFVLRPAPPALPLGEPVGRPQRVRQVDLRDFGAMIARYGDLDGDGEADAVFVQTAGQQITCVTAVTLAGKILWQRGKPDAEHYALSSDAAAQVYDLDGDGANEVFIIEGKTLRILDGRTGKVKREAPVASNDSLLIANLTGGPRPRDLVIKDRYSHIWVYDADLKLRWESEVNCGHYPMNLDLDGDGRDELLCGYRCYSPDGKILWDHPELPQHNDAVDADDMDGDGKPEVAIACSQDSVLLDADGRILWRKPHRHSQHAVIGAFCPERQGKQVVFVDRGRGGVVGCYLKDGTEVWESRPQGWLTIASTVDGWSGEPARSLLLLYRRECGPPVLVNGRGEQVAEFPFPPACPKGAWEQYFVQHFDVLGDSREEILVHAAGALWVYTNDAPAPPGLPAPDRKPDPRVYNASFYVGRQ